MREIIVDGKRYIPAEECGKIKIVVMERGFVYVGRVDDVDDPVTIRNARALIRWGTNNHLGQLVNGPLPNTKLGASCTVRCFLRQIIHAIEVNQDAWNKHID